jgi:DUF4097 and DUF4098 domain-containing protein YvlB
MSFPLQVLRYTNAHLRLGVPDGLTFVIKAGSADVSISAEIGRSKIVSGSGDVTIGNAVDLECSTGSGDISVALLDGNAARLISGADDVSISEVHCPVMAKSGSGDIAVASTSGSVDVRSASGSLTIGVADNLPAWLELNSVSGDIRIALESTTQPGLGEPYISVRARTASGDIAIYRA